MAGNRRIFVSYANGDRAVAVRLAALLRDAGSEVWIDSPAAGDTVQPPAAIETALQACDTFVVLLSPRALASTFVRLEVERALSLKRRILTVIVAPCDVPRELRSYASIDLSQAPERDSAAWLPLITGTEIRAAQVAAPYRTDVERVGRSGPVTLPPRIDLSIDTAPRKASSGLAGVFGAPLKMARGMAGWLKNRVTPAPRGTAASTTSTPSTATTAAPAAPPAVPDAPAPLFFGVTAPKRAVAGSEFTVSLAAYIEAAKDEAAKLARTLVGPGARQIFDIEPDGGSVWCKGTPFTVQLSGRWFSLQQPEQGFQWNGRKNVLGFAVQMLPEAQASAVLMVTVLVQDIVVARIPAQIAVVQAGATAPVADEPVQKVKPAPRSAFASYASKDAHDVTGRLASLTRFAPGLDIFLDCLDLHPGEPYKPQLEAQIAERDVFWLFWSRSAAASPWVGWELETALAKKPADAIVPMPLEDPALAPPPKQLEHEHFRDRFSIAGLAMAQIAAQKAGESPPR